MPQSSGDPRVYVAVLRTRNTEIRVLAANIGDQLDVPVTAAMPATG
jgi:hypothetical protein